MLDCHQLRLDVDHFNRVHPDEEQYELPLNFEDDVREMMVAEGIEEVAQPPFFHRAVAAVLAISERCSGVKAFARAGPPFEPALCARTCFAVGGRSSTSPLAISIINLASWAGSRGRLGCFMAATEKCHGALSRKAQS